jgi:hypothetical protein
MRVSREVELRAKLARVYTALHDSLESVTHRPRVIWVLGTL